LREIAQHDAVGFELGDHLFKRRGRAMAVPSHPRDGALRAVDRRVDAWQRIVRFGCGPPSRGVVGIDHGAVTAGSR
jgi:hypothetical protein